MSLHFSLREITVCVISVNSRTCMHRVEMLYVECVIVFKQLFHIHEWLF